MWNCYVTIYDLTKVQIGIQSMKIVTTWFNQVIVKFLHIMIQIGISNWQLVHVFYSEITISLSCSCQQAVISYQINYVDTRPQLHEILYGKIKTWLSYRTSLLRVPLI